MNRLLSAGERLRAEPDGERLGRAVRVVVVEDEAKLAALIQQAIREDGELADGAIMGEDALWMAAATPCQTPRPR